MRAVISLLPHGQVQGLFRQVSFSACLSSARPVSQPVSPAFFVLSLGCLLECLFAVFRLSFCCFPACLITGFKRRHFPAVSDLPPDGLGSPAVSAGFSFCVPFFVMPNSRSVQARFSFSCLPEAARNMRSLRTCFSRFPPSPSFFLLLSDSFTLRCGSFLRLNPPQYYTDDMIP